MKQYIRQALLLTAMISFCMSAQEKKEQPAATPAAAAPIQTPTDKTTGIQFTDRNADGIDDNSVSAHTLQQNRKKSRDRFVDADGDGICDGRASGAGIRLKKKGITISNTQRKGKK